MQGIQVILGSMWTNMDESTDGNQTNVTRRRVWSFPFTWCEDFESIKYPKISHKIGETPRILPRTSENCFINTFLPLWEYPVKELP